MRESSGRTAAVNLERVIAGYVDGVAVLQHVTLELPNTGLVRLNGENGAGKSTFIELVSGHLMPWSGSVTIGGRPAHSAAARASRRVCRSRPALFPGMTARDHLLFAAMCTGGSRRALLERADRLGLGEWLNSDSATLSTGTVRKLWLLMCTAGDFDVVLLDEPLNGLDADAVGLVADDVARWSQSGLVVLVSHFLPSGLDGVERLDIALGSPATYRVTAKVANQ